MGYNYLEISNLYNKARLKKLKFNEFTVLPIDFKNSRDSKFLEEVSEFKGEVPTNIIIDIYNLKEFNIKAHLKLLAFACSVFLPKKIKLNSRKRKDSIDFLKECLHLMEYKAGKILK